MKYINEQQRDYEKYLKQFEPVLNKYGYYYKGNEISGDGKIAHFVNYFYTNLQNNLKITFTFADCVLSKGDSQSASFNFKIENDKGQIFSFNFYDQIPYEMKKYSDCVDHNENFDHEMKVYFSGVESAFDTYLNDQITGKFLEDHTQKMKEYWANLR